LEAVSKRPSAELRTGLATFCVAVCIAAISVVGAVAERVNASWVRGTESPEARIIVRLEGAASTWEEATRLIKGMPGVEDVVAVYSGGLAPDETDDSGWVSVSWVATDSTQARRAYPSPSPGVSLGKGELPSGGSQTGVVLGYELARVLGLDIGDEISVQENSFTVEGIWSPSDAETGNFVQVPIDAALNRFPGSRARPNYLAVYVRRASDAAGVARGIWQGIPGSQVSSPEDERTRLHDEVLIWRGILILLLLWALAAGILVFVYAFAGDCVASGAYSEPHRVIVASVGSAALAGIIGVLSGGLIGLAMNVYAQRVYARTFFFLTSRLGIVALVVALVSGALAAIWVLLGGWLRQRRSQWGATGQGMHWAIVVLVVGIGTCLLIMGGAVTESLYASLDEVRQVALRRVGVRLHRPSMSVLPRLGILPGVEGLAVEAYGGAVNENEEGWGDRLPPSGVFYGVDSESGGPGMSLWHRTGLWQGRGIRRGSLDEAVVGFDLAEFHDLQVGDPLKIRGREFTVVGIRRRCVYGMPGDSNWRVDVSLEAMRRLTHQPYALDSIALFVPPVEQEDRREVFLSDLSGRVPEGIVVSSAGQLDAVAVAYPLVFPLAADQQGEMARRARFMYSLAYLVLVVLVSLVMGSAIWAAVSLYVIQQRGRTALEMILGMGAGSILSDQTLNAASWSLVGAILGGLAAWWLIRLANVWIAGSGMDLPFLLASPRLFVVAATWSAVLTIVVAFLPVLHGLRNEPLEALIRPDFQSRKGVAV